MKTDRVVGCKLPISADAVGSVDFNPSDMMSIIGWGVPVFAYATIGAGVEGSVPKSDAPEPCRLLLPDGGLDVTGVDPSEATVMYSVLFIRPRSLQTMPLQTMP